MTNQQVAYTMQKKIADSFSNFMSDLLKDCDLPEDMADLPLNFNSPVYGSANPNFTEFMAPGIIIIIIFFLAVALTGEAFIAEKQVRPFLLLLVLFQDILLKSVHFKKTVARISFLSIRIKIYHNFERKEICATVFLK